MIISLFVYGTMAKGLHPHLHPDHLSHCSTKMPIVHATHRWSTLEKILSITSNDLYFLEQFFYHWPIRELIRLGQTNLTLYCMVRAYIGKAWDIRSLLRRWFRHPEGLLDMMRDSSSIIHGRTVLRFFHRSMDENEALELCTPMPHVLRAASALEQEQYIFQPSDRLSNPSFMRALRDAVDLRPGALRSWGAERSTDPAAHSRALRFYFARSTTLRDGTIQVHWIQLNVVNYEPHRFLLSQHSSMCSCNLMNAT
jgi:hypothetical protein